MTDTVPADRIEQIVGADRDPDRHWARAVSDEQQVYILHSNVCLAERDDPRNCPLSLALDRGIDVAEWAGHEDKPVRITTRNGRLIPTTAGRGL